jgi:LCP family protein required for cell wall assembly
VSRWEQREGVYTFLLAGTDLDDYNTDSLMLATLDVNNETVNVMSIPRDTQVTDENGKVRKINAAWGMGGIDRLSAQIKTLIGFVPNAYAVVDLNGFIKLVDALGGVDFDVPRNMYTAGTTPDLTINLKKGWQHLNGKQALQLVRYRHGYSTQDLGRIEMQHEFLMTLAKQVLSVGSLFKIREFADIAEEDLRTNLDLGQLIWLGEKLLKIDEDNIHFYTLPGDTGYYYRQNDYVLAREEEMIALINDKFNPFVGALTGGDISVSRVYD